MGTLFETLLKTLLFIVYKFSRATLELAPLRPLHLLTDGAGEGQQRTAALLMETVLVGSAAKNQSWKKGALKLALKSRAYVSAGCVITFVWWFITVASLICASQLHFHYGVHSRVQKFPA